MPLLIAAGIGAASSAFGAYQGYKQKKEGEKALAGLTAPTYEIPEEIKQNLSDAEAMEVEGLTASEKKAFVQNIERSQQSALKAQADRKGGLLGIQGSMQAESDAYSNLTSMDASARKQSELEKQARVSQARQAMASAKDRELAFREGRYQEDLASGQAMVGAGQQNIMQGIQGIGSAAIGFMGASSNPDSDAASNTGGYRNSGYADTITRQNWKNLGRPQQ
jgi:hypothetical protein